MQWWEWLKKGWETYTKAVQLELMAYLPTLEEEEGGYTGDSLVYNDQRDEIGNTDRFPSEHSQTEDSQDAKLQSEPR